MNVLIIVFTMLMLLNIMTYTRLQSFISFSAIRTAYKEYMTQNERKYTNNIEQTLYEKARAKVAQAKGDEEDDICDEEPPYTAPGQPAPPPKPIRKLNLRPLLTGAPDGSDNPLAAPTADLFRNLIIQLYGNQNFFKEALAKDPELVNQIINTFLSMRDKKVCGAPLTDLKDIEKVPFRDQIAREVYKQMLPGMESIPRLDDYATICSQPTPIRMFGTPKALLMAIYKDPNVVDSLLSRRNELYYALKSDRMTKDEATKIFKSEFGSESMTSYPASMLDFGVAKTRPTQ